MHSCFYYCTFFFISHYSLTLFYIKMYKIKVIHYLYKSLFYNSARTPSIEHHFTFLLHINADLLNFLFIKEYHAFNIDNNVKATLCDFYPHLAVKRYMTIHMFLSILISFLTPTVANVVQD